MRYFLIMSDTPSPSTEMVGKSPVIGYVTPSTAPPNAVIWCRILALWMFAWGLETALTALEYDFGSFINRSPSETYPFLFMMFVLEFLPAALWLLIAWYCWRKAPALAVRMTRELQPSTSHPPMAPDELLSIIVMGIGIFLLTAGLTGIAQAMIQIFENIRENGRLFTSILESHLISIARCILGLWLILGTQGVVTLLRRYGGKWRDNSKIQNEQ